MQMTEPKIETHPEQPYVGIRSQVSMKNLNKFIPEKLEQIFAWLDKQGIRPAGPPLIRYHVIDMAGKMDVEMGVPVASGIAVGPTLGDESIHNSFLPAGRYASLIYTGVKNGVKANAALLDWGKQQGLVWDQYADPNGDGFGARYESMLTGPKDDPNPDNWQTEVLIRLAES